MTNIIKFSSPPRAGGFYTCDAPGDHTGEYVEVGVADGFATELLSRTSFNFGGGWLMIAEPDLYPVAEYLKERGIIQRSKDNTLFRWLAAEAKEAR